MNKPKTETENCIFDIEEGCALTGHTYMGCLVQCEGKDKCPLWRG